MTPRERIITMQDAEVTVPDFVPPVACQAARKNALTTVRAAVSVLVPRPAKMPAKTAVVILVLQIVKTIVQIAAILAALLLAAQVAAQDAGIVAQELVMAPALPLVQQHAIKFVIMLVMILVFLYA